MTLFRTGLLALAALSLAGPGRAADRDAKLTVGWAEPIDVLNPALTSARDVGPLLINMFDTLVWLTPDLKATPGLAKSWTVSPDGKTYSFTLRDDVTFHDGAPFDADAVVANVAFITDKKTQSKISLSLLGPCGQATAAAKYTVEFHCSTPYAPLLLQLGEPYLGMQSPKAIQQYGADLAMHPVGTGPFSLVSYTPNQSLIVKRNDDYKWNPPATNHSGPPDIAQITFQIVPNSQARISAFQSGQSDMMQETPGIFFKMLAAGGRFTAVPVPISGLGIFAPIDAKKWPTSEVAVRKAILYATDKQGVIQLADNGSHPISNTPLEPGMLGYDAALGDMYPYDPAKAEATLKADGWSKNGEFYEKDGKRLTLNLTAIATVPEYPLLAQAIQGYLRKAGMDAQVTQLAVPAWYAANLNAESSLTPLQYVGVDPDALHLWYLPDQYFNFAHFTDPALTDAITQGQQESDPAKRTQFYQQAQKIIMEQALVMPIHLNVDQVMISKNLTGLTWSGGGFEYFGAAQLAK